MNVNINPNEFHRMKQINLSNYYRNNVERKIIHCQICKFDIFRCHVFEHTISQRHKYNKLFIAIVQGRSYNTDIDFIVLNIDRLQCRFCNFVIINSDRDDLVISHLQDATHAMRKKIFLEMIDTSRQRNFLVESALLKPVDDSIQPDKEHEKRVNKPAKNIKKKVKIPKKTIPIAEESTSTNKNNVDQNESLKYSVLSRDYERRRGEKLPEFIAIDKWDTCICTICSIKIPMKTFNVGGHIDGKKHKRNMLKFPKSTPPNSEVRTTIAASKGKNNVNNVTETVIELKAANTVDKNTVESNLLKPVDDSIKPDKEYEKHVNKPAKNNKTTVKIPKKTIPITEESLDRNNADQSASLKYSVLSGDYERQRGEKLPEFIAIDKGDTCICTICSIKIPMSTFNVGGHIDGKKHKRNMLKFLKSTPPKSEVQTTIAASKGKNNVNNVTEKVIELKQLTKELKAANTVESDLLKPVDDSIKPDKEHEKLVNKPAKNIKERVKIPKKTIPITEESTDRNNADQNESLKYSVLSRDYERQRGEKLPEFITIDKWDTCICTICSIKISMNTFSVGEHIDSKKHKRTMLKFPKSTPPNSEVQTTIAASKGKNNVNNVTEKVIELKQLTKELKAANNVDKNNVLKCSTSSRDIKVKSREKLLDCLSFGTSSVYECKFCLAEFSCSSSRAIKKHNKGKIHQRKRRESLTSMSHELELQSTFDEISEEESDWEIFDEEFEELPEENKEHKAASISTTKNKTYTCITCLQTIPRDKLNIERHKNGKKHKNNIQKWKILQKNSRFLSAKNSLGHISKMNDIHYCEICKKCLPKNSLITIHVNGKQHKKKMPTLTPGERVNSTEHKNQILSLTRRERAHMRKQNLILTARCRIFPYALL